MQGPQASAATATLRALKSLSIGIDARAAVEVAAGRGRFVRETLAALSRRDDDVRYLCYARSRWGEELDDRFEWRLIDARDPAWHLLTARAANRECDVFLSTNSYLTTWMLRIPAVPVIYDMIAFDRAYRPNRRSVMIERLTLGLAVRRSRAFIAISHATAEDFERRFPAAAGRVTVAPLGVAPQLAATLPTRDDSDLPRAGFVLAVGTLEPRKNLPRLVAAYELLDEQLQREHPIVVVGDVGWQVDDTIAKLRSLGDRSVLLGHVSDGVLAELYRRCAVFCYPSLYEGFGLPVLEAMAAGAAVVTSDVSSLPEVGGDAVEYADPRDPVSIAHAMTRLLSSPERRAAIGVAARERAALFDWGRTADTVLEVLRDAAA
ncbi:MAG: glycosyltransferase family 4 protein [Solirubrobacterales bacterium]|nr:glycosyltransferase family 4 protein [Solirubrobacterales bacterium]